MNSPGEISIRIDPRVWIRTVLGRTVKLSPYGFLARQLGIGQGPKEFLYRLASNDFEKLRFTPFLRDADAALCIASLSEYALRKVERYRVPLFTRLDGVGFDSYSLDKSRRIAVRDSIERALASSAGVIFQSEFARQTYHHCYKSLPTAHTVICNGVAPDSQTYMSVRRESSKHIFVAGGRAAPRKRIEETIKRFLGSPCSERVSLKIVGEVDGPHHDSIQYMGKLSPEVLNKVLQAADGLIHLDWYDWCPNLVIEAIMVGTPVLCGAIGGTPEIVRNSGICFDFGDPLPVFDTAHLQPVPEISQEDFDQAIEAFMAFVDIGIMPNRDDLSIDTASARYEQFITQILE